jgi:hypothetical protein
MGFSITQEAIDLSQSIPLVQAELGRDATGGGFAGQPSVPEIGQNLVEPEFTLNTVEGYAVAGSAVGH